MATILLIDDDDDFSALLQPALEAEGHSVEWLERAEPAPQLLETPRFDLVLLDNRMPGMTGIEFLGELGRRQCRVPVILMTSQGTTGTAIAAMELGAFDYVVKPLEVDELVAELRPLIEKAAEIAELTRKEVRLAEEQTGDLAELVLLGNSRAMQGVCKLIGTVARSDTSVLIRGETGTGKELVARAVHAHSTRKGQRFVAMNCTSFNENLLDDELFGHEPGAFTGADKLRKGCFEYANGGTLFLDEIGDMPPPLQAKLLRVLERQEVLRIGSNEAIRVDVRVLSATHRNLEQAIRDGKFREDLFYRLNGLTIYLPPLRERGPDVELLSKHFLFRAAQIAARSIPNPEPATWSKLNKYHWPGNVRQLRNVIQRAVLLCRGRQLLPEHIDFGADDAVRPAPAARAMEEQDAIAAMRKAIEWGLNNGRTNLYALLHDMLERELLRLALEEFRGNQAQVAKRLGIARNTVHARIKSYGLG